MVISEITESGTRLFQAHRFKRTYASVRNQQRPRQGFLASQCTGKEKVSSPSRVGFIRKFTLLLEYRPTFSIHHCYILISQSAQVLLDRSILHKATLHSRLSLQVFGGYFFGEEGVGLVVFLFGSFFGVFLLFLVYKKVTLHSVSKDRRIFWNRQSKTSCLSLIRLSKEYSAGYQTAFWA